MSEEAARLLALRVRPFEGQGVRGEWRAKKLEAQVWMRGSSRDDDGDDDGSTIAASIYLNLSMPRFWMASLGPCSSALSTMTEACLRHASAPCAAWLVSEARKRKIRGCILHISNYANLVRLGYRTTANFGKKQSASPRPKIRYHHPSKKYRTMFIIVSHGLDTLKHAKT